jgi:hypothetical protein
LIASGSSEETNPLALRNRREEQREDRQIMPGQNAIPMLAIPVAREMMSD